MAYAHASAILQLGSQIRPLQAHLSTNQHRQGPTRQQLGRQCLQSHGRSGRLQLFAVSTEEIEETAMEMEIKVEGMSSEGCTSSIQDALKQLPGVDGVQISEDTGIVTVNVEAVDQMEAAFVQMPKMVEVINKLGFKAQAHFGDMGW